MNEDHVGPIITIILAALFLVFVMRTCERDKVTQEAAESEIEDKENGQIALITELHIEPGTQIYIRCSNGLSPYEVMDLAFKHDWKVVAISNRNYERALIVLEKKEE